MLIESPGSSGTGGQGTFEAMLRASIEAGVIVVDQTGSFTGINPEAVRILGLSSEARLDLAQLPDPLRHLIEEARDQRVAIVNRVLVLSPADAQPVLAVASAVPSITPSRPATIVTFQLVTAHAHAEQNVRRLDRLASVGTLSASIAHEIKNALVAVRTFVELLLEKHPDTELASIVRREIARVDSMVTQLLRFSAPSQPRFAAVHLHKLLDHSLRLVQHGFRHKTVTMKIELKADPDIVCGDDYQLEQAFVNLLFNAVEAIATEGLLTVQTDFVREGAGNGPCLRIRISDTGAGIPAEKVPHIFEPFFTTKQHGTGLGLAVTRKIVHEHHGTISVESSAGSGTTFTVLLPAGSPGV
ncbi:MAG TPA: ATP-binding protein [Verrucomicrobiae bacterium]|nr:ATP-binding protein [Verrucomicrobiae bacterium]